MFLLFILIFPKELQISILISSFIVKKNGKIDFTKLRKMGDSYLTNEI